MERAFRKAPYPDVVIREELARKLGLNESRVQVQTGIILTAMSKNLPSDMCAQRRLKLESSFPHEDTLRHCLSKMRSVKILIRLRECAV